MLQANWTTLGLSRELAELAAGANATGLPRLPRLDGDLLFSSGVTLRPDWEARLDDALEDATPLLASGALKGVFVGDEPTAQGLPYADLVEIVDRAAGWLSLNAPADARIVYYNDSIYVAAWAADEPVPHPDSFQHGLYRWARHGRAGRAARRPVAAAPRRVEQSRRRRATARRRRSDSNGRCGAAAALRPNGRDAAGVVKPP